MLKSVDQTITVWRSDFRDAQTPGEPSMFEGILQQLNIPKTAWDNIEEVTLTITEFETSR